MNWKRIFKMLVVKKKTRKNYYLTVFLKDYLLTFPFRLCKKLGWFKDYKKKQLDNNDFVNLRRFYRY